MWFLQKQAEISNYTRCIYLYRNVDDYCKYRKLMEVYSSFTTREWKFNDSNVTSLLRSLSSEDKELFYFDLTQLQWTQYLADYVAGTRHFLLKEDTNTAPAARKRHTVYVHMVEGAKLYSEKRLIIYATIYLPFTEVKQ